MCQRLLEKAGLLCRKSSRHIRNINETGNGGLIHTEGVAYNLKETSTCIKPEGNLNLVERWQGVISSPAARFVLNKMDSVLKR